MVGIGTPAGDDGVRRQRQQRQRQTSSDDSRARREATDVGGSVAQEDAGSLGVKDGLVLFTFAVVVVVVVGVVGIGTPTGDDDSDVCSSDDDDYDGHATMAPVRRQAARSIPRGCWATT